MIIKDYCRNMIICSKEKEGRGEVSWQFKNDMFFSNNFFAKNFGDYEKINYLCPIKS